MWFNLYVSCIALRTGEGSREFLEAIQCCADFNEYQFCRYYELKRYLSEKGAGKSLLKSAHCCWASFRRWQIRTGLIRPRRIRWLKREEGELIIIPFSEIVERA